MFEPASAQPGAQPQPRNVEVSTWDFTTLYTSLPLDDLTNRMQQLVRQCFAHLETTLPGKSSPTQILVIKCGTHSSSFHWHSSLPEDKQHTKHITADRLCRWLGFLINNTFITIGKSVFKQRVGIPMGTNCAPQLANLYLFSYEFEFAQEQRRLGNIATMKKMARSHRYIDDLLNVNWPDFDAAAIYPPALSLNCTMKGKEVDFLDVTISRDRKGWHTSLYRKPISLTAPRCPPLMSELSEQCKYGVVTSQLHRFSRRCNRLKNFWNSTFNLLDHMVKAGYEVRRLIHKVKAFRPQMKLSPSEWTRNLRLFETRLLTRSGGSF